MVKNRKYVKTDITFPTSLFYPLVKSCFSTRIKRKNCYKFVIPDVLQLHFMFSNFKGLGKLIASKSTMGKYNFVPSDENLSEYKEKIKNCYETTVLTLKVPYETFIKTRSACYHGGDIMNFKEKGISDETILKEIDEDALAYTYWCMSEIRKGKRIGVMAYKRGHPDKLGNYPKKGSPDLDTFVELPMQCFFPKYNKKKGFCIEDADFIVNAPKRSEEFFLEMLSYFKKGISENKDKEFLHFLENKIRFYSVRLDWDCNKFFKKMGWEYK